MIVDLVLLYFRLQELEEGGVLLEGFSGSTWPETKCLKDKRTTIIGNGSVSLVHRIHGLLYQSPIATAFVCQMISRSIPMAAYVC
jgi:hypothetical protein